MGSGCGSYIDSRASYVKLSYGTATCPAGQDVTTQAECEKAVSAFGFTGLNNPWVGTYSRIPRWCSVRQTGSDPRVHFGGGSSGGVGRSDLAPICKVIQNSYKYIGEGTLVSEPNDGWFRTMQYAFKRTGLDLEQVKDRLGVVCSEMSTCVGYHVHPVELLGALLFNNAQILPVVTFLVTKAQQNWVGWPDSASTGPPANHASLSVGKGWNGWQAYQKRQA